MAQKIKYLFLLLSFFVLFLLLAANNTVFAACTLPNGQIINDGATWREINCGGQLDTGAFCDKGNEKLEYTCNNITYTQSCVTDPDCQPTQGGTGGSSSQSTSVFQYGSGLGIYGTPPACYIGDCPLELESVYPSGEKCVKSFDE